MFPGHDLRTIYYILVLALYYYFLCMCILNVCVHMCAGVCPSVAYVCGGQRSILFVVVIIIIVIIYRIFC